MIEIEPPCVQGHKGLVKPFKPGPPGIKLKGGDLEKLRKGEAVKQQLSAGSGGRGLVIQVGRRGLVDRSAAEGRGPCMGLMRGSSSIHFNALSPIQQYNNRSIQDVHAPPEVVWGRILDFPAYTRMVPRVTLCENYKIQDKFLEVRTRI